MADRDKIIKELERLSEWLFQQYRVVYDGDAPNYYDAYKTVDDAIAMLKEQEGETETKQIWSPGYGDYANKCECGAVWINVYNTVPNYCPGCGKAVKWDE